MKIILFLLFLGYIYTDSCGVYPVYGELKKDKSVKITINNYLTYYYCVYLDLNDFKDEKSLYFKITIHNGYWYDSYMYYDTFNTYDLYDKKLCKSAKYDSESYGTKSTYTGSYYYDYDTFRYVIDKPSTDKRYLYIGYPTISHYGVYSIEIENVSGFGLSVAVIVIIVIAVVAIVAASIIVYFCRRARRASYIAPPVAQYQPPVATAYPPPTYY